MAWGNPGDWHKHGLKKHLMALCCFSVRDAVEVAGMRLFIQANVYAVGSKYLEDYLLTCLGKNKDLFLIH